MPLMTLIFANPHFATCGNNGCAVSTINATMGRFNRLDWAGGAEKGRMGQGHPLTIGWPTFGQRLALDWPLGQQFASNWPLMARRLANGWQIASHGWAND
eukprot:437310-Lingulodinium_polyedra.AAC.1